MTDKKRRKLKKPVTLKEAINQTIMIHQTVIDGEFETYYIAKRILNDGECPLCLYNKFRNKMNSIDGMYWSSCDYCPWIKIQGSCCSQKFAGIKNVLDYNDSIKSIKRLKRWLKGKPYIKKGK